MPDSLINGFTEGLPFEVDSYEIDPHAISGIQEGDGDIQIDPAQQ